ncbi:MAG TPA: diacylglycerol kinase family protein [Candidatus Eisenbacteria bacterium]|nr:diacylglycerol kinase family protein [Candidatus Eisenbacteria bacterium]
MSAREPRDAADAPGRPPAPRSEPLLIFANRSAGSVLRGGEPPLVRFARAAGLEAQVIPARSAADLQRQLRARALGRLSRVAIAGGDGTLHAAVQVLAGSDVTLGILPQGTANNFATALHIPRDLPSAFRVIAEGEERRVDLGLAGGEYFTEAAGVGVFADLLAFTGAGHNLRHTLRGLEVLARAVLFDRPQRVTLEVDGERSVEEVLNVTVANTFAVGYNLPIAPGARATDARLDVIVIGSLTRREMPLYWRALRRQEHLDLPKVHAMRARRVTLSARHRLLVHVDDRVIRRTPLELQVAPAALKVMVDRL